MSESLQMGGEFSVPTRRNLRLLPALELVYVDTEECAFDIETITDQDGSEGGSLIINLTGSDTTYDPFGDQFDWAEAAAAGLHLVGPGSNVHSSSSGHHSSYLGGQLRAGNDLNSLD